MLPLYISKDRNPNDPAGPAVLSGWRVLLPVPGAVALPASLVSAPL
jgi:hypothetical protein